MGQASAVQTEQDLLLKAVSVMLCISPYLLVELAPLRVASEQENIHQLLGKGVQSQQPTAMRVDDHRVVKQKHTTN